MDIALRAVFRTVPEGYIGYVEELPGANTQGSTLDEARESLLEAVELVLEANRTMAKQEGGQTDIREPLQAAHRGNVASSSTIFSMFTPLHDDSFRKK
jgi:predicted RNase H-like HicB family nuclease